MIVVWIRLILWKIIPKSVEIILDTTKNLSQEKAKRVSQFTMLSSILNMTMIKFKEKF